MWPLRLRQQVRRKAPHPRVVLDMAAKAKFSANPEVSVALRGVGTQIRELDFRDASSWPDIPKYILLAIVAAIVVGVLWLLWLSDSKDDLQAAHDREAKLRTEFQTKVQKAVSLEPLKKQREQVLQQVSMLEKQLPSKAEMDALLSDINQAGLGRSLQFESFRPAPIIVRDYYAEQPIALKVSGAYHDIGAFTADVANLSRIVTLNNIAVSQPAGNDKNSRPGALVMEATAKTFRYLDPEERAAQQAASKSKPGGRK
jgi:type IV pilus assembly protein PilO